MFHETYTLHMQSVMDSERPPQRIVRLISQENEVFEVQEAVAMLSNLVKISLEDEPGDAPEAPLIDVKSSTLAKVVEFCTHYVLQDAMQEIPKPIPWPKRVPDVVQPFYARFVMLLSYKQLFDLILAANYMDIPPLLDLCCARVGRLIMNKTPEEIRTIFQLDEEFTPQEYETLLDENKWSTEPVQGEDMEAEPSALLDKLRAEAQLDEPSSFS